MFAAPRNGRQQDAAIAFICHSGQRSGASAEKARAAGYANTCHVTGGVSLASGWIETGLPAVAAGPK
jgi:rhodanese-related sulfurtransferase